LNQSNEAESGCSLISGVLHPAESLYGYFIGDIRVNTGPSTANHGDIFSIGFANSDGDISAGGNTNGRNNTRDDQCYAIYDSARLNIVDIFRSSGSALALWTRVLGVMIEEI